MRLTRTAGYAGRLLLLMCSVEIADGVITHFLVRHGQFQEGNPLMASIVDNGSFVPLKLLGALICVPALLALYRRFPRLAVATISSVVAFYGTVIAWNVSVVLAA